MPRARSSRGLVAAAWLAVLGCAATASEQGPARDEPDAIVEPAPNEREPEPEREREPVLEEAPDAEPGAGEVDDDTSDDLVVGPPDEITDCHDRLQDAGVAYETSALPVRKTKAGMLCGAPQVVRVRKGPSGIKYAGAPRMSCPLALAVARFETIVQEEAEAHFGRRVVRIEHMGTYNCREMAAYPGWVSEHSYANALDIEAFVLQGGTEIPVIGRYGKGQESPSHAAGRFLRAVAARAYDEDVFSVVLTPRFDRAHHNHFHLDVARYRVDGTGRTTQ